MNSANVGTYLIVEAHCGTYDIDPDCRNSLDANLTDYGRVEGRDRLIHMTDANGEDVALWASAISGFQVSTPEGRLRAMIRDKQMEDEFKRLRTEVGYLPGD